MVSYSASDDCWDEYLGSEEYKDYVRAQKVQQRLFELEKDIKRYFFRNNFDKLWQKRIEQLRKAGFTEKDCELLVDILISPQRNNLFHDDKYQYTAIYRHDKNKINYGVNNFWFFLNNARFYGSNIQRIYHTPGFSRTAQSIMRLICGWCEFGVMNEGHWDAVFYKNDEEEIITAFGKILKQRYITRDFFPLIKNKFKCSRNKELFNKQLAKFQVRLYTFRN